MSIALMMSLDAMPCPSESPSSASADNTSRRSGDHDLSRVSHAKKTRAKRTRLLQLCRGGACNRTSGRRGAGNFMARHSLRHRLLRESGNGTSTPKVLYAEAFVSARWAATPHRLGVQCYQPSCRLLPFCPLTRRLWTGNTSSDWFTGTNWRRWCNTDTRYERHPRHRRAKSNGGERAGRSGSRPDGWRIVHGCADHRSRRHGVQHGSAASDFRRVPRGQSP